MTDLFSPMPRPDRTAFQLHYRDYLRSRDGVPCLESRTLSRRELSYRELDNAPVRRTGEPIVDPVVFQRNLLRCQPEPGLDAPTLWALAVAKGNRAERFGVENKLRIQGFEPGGAEDLLTYVELQEVYHTKLLLRALEVIGLSCEIGEPVGRVTRVGVMMLARLPRPIIEVLALAFELVGIAAFHALRREAHALFADQPEALARIDALFSELLVDEVGHVHFLRSRLGPVRLGVSRAALVFAKRSLFNDNHEIQMLLDRTRALDGLETLDVDALVADCPHRLPPLRAA
ncbi:MAG: hypothetical protein U0271_37910 [Polyangiaceae bacterium]